jgi:high-affinity Fe2+/Pb2+ permease
MHLTMDANTVEAVKAVAGAVVVAVAAIAIAWVIVRTEDRP